jgi:hypothetical protein
VDREPAQKAPHLAFGRQVQAASGFVEEVDLGAADERAAFVRSERNFFYGKLLTESEVRSAQTLAMSYFAQTNDAVVAII